MTRGDIVIVTPKGDFGKPRPAVVIQSGWLAETDSVLVALLTTTLVDAPLYRLTVHPGEESGLREVSQIMTDKIIAYPRHKCSAAIGKIDAQTLLSLNASLAFVLGLAD